MKRIILTISLILLGLILQAQTKLPAIKKPGDTVKATSNIWIQSIDSEIDQRIELKHTKLKLNDYIEKTKELEVIQDSIVNLKDKKISLLKEGIGERDTVIIKLSKLIDECSSEAVVLRKEVVLLQKDLEKSEKAKVFWRKVGLISTSALAIIIAIKFL